MQKRPALALAAALCVIVSGAIYVLTRSDVDAPAEPAPDNASASVADARHVLSGRVVGFDGAKIAGAEVVAGEAVARTDEAGRFVFEVLPAGPLVVDARAAGWISPGPDAARGRRVEIVAGQALDGLELVLRRPAKLTGRVIGPQGQAIPDAKIGLHYLFADGVGGPLEPFMLDEVARTNAQGAFVLPEIAPGRLRALVEAPGYALAMSQEVYLRDGQAGDALVIAVGAAHRLKLSVLTTAGEPPQGVTVSLRGPGIVGSIPITLDARGAAAREGLGEGVFVVEARAPGYAPERVEVELIEGEVEAEAQLVLEPLVGLSLTVQTPDGQPVRGAAVDVVCNGVPQGRMWSGAEGEVFLEGAGGQCEAQAIAREGMSDKVAVVAGQHMTLKLGQGARLVGRVVDEAGRPVTSYQLVVEQFSAAAGPPIFHATSFGRQYFNRADGRFELGPLLPGEFTLRAAPQSGPHGMSKPVRVSAGATSAEIVIVLPAGGQITGVVRDEAGKPIAGAQVQIFDMESPLQHGSAVTDAQGRYTVPGVAPGRRSARASAQGYLTQLEGNISVTSNRSVTRDIVLTKADPKARFAFHGVGAVLRKDGDDVLIQSLIDGSPAAAYGLKEGDRIVSVDGDATSGMTLGHIVERIRGEEGAAVRMEVDREGEGRLTVEITRGRVVVRDDINVGDR